MGKSSRTFQKVTSLISSFILDVLSNLKKKQTQTVYWVVNQVFSQEIAAFYLSVHNRIALL